MNNIVIAEGYAIMRIVRRQEKFKPTMREIKEAFALSNDEVTLVGESVVESILGIGNDPEHLEKMETRELLKTYVKSSVVDTDIELRGYVIPASLVKSTLESYFIREVK